MTQHSHVDVSSNTIFGFWIYLMTDCVMFATFFATYAVLHNNTYGGPTAKELLDLRFALGETMVLLLSSFTCALGLMHVPTKNLTKIVGWLGVTFVLGAIFIGMEFTELSGLIAKGQTWQSNAFLSSFFTLIGVHGLHVFAGLLIMPLFVWQLLKSGFTEMVLRRLTCLRMYWHFLYLIWIFTFAIVYLIGGQ